MLGVILIDDLTRIILPDSAWGIAVEDKLIEMGHSLEWTDQDPESCTRDEPELARMGQLLESTGL